MFECFNFKERNKLPKASVLVIENNKTDRVFLQKILKKRGFRVFMSENGQNGILLANQESPDVIILDYCLPDMNGQEVCRTLKGNKKTEKIPVIFLTVVEDGYTMLQCYNAGAENFLTKPINAKFLLNEVKLILFELEKCR